MKDIDIKAGILLRRERTLRGYSQDELAKSMGITFQQIQKYERGLNRITISRLFQMCEFLEIPPNLFIANIPAESIAEIQDLSGIKDFLAIPVKTRVKLIAFHNAVKND